MLHPGTSYSVTETHFRSSSGKIREERGATPHFCFLCLQSSAWSVVHTCVLVSASTAATPCFSVPVSACPSAPGWMPRIAAFSQTYNAVLTEPTPNPVKNYFALALSKVINKQTNDVWLLRVHLYEDGAYGKLARNLSMQLRPFKIALPILPSTNYRPTSKKTG